MNDKTVAKAAIWAERIRSFQDSGLRRKDWCQQNGIPLSTFSYWCRKLETAGNMTGLCDGTVFARLPSEQELCPGSLGQAPVTVCLSRDIRIEISAGCPAGLVSALLCALKSHA